VAGCYRNDRPDAPECAAKGPVFGERHLMYRRFLIQQLVSQAAVEALDEAILLRFAGVDVVPIDVVIASPLQDRTTGELRPVVADNSSWTPAITYWIVASCDSLIARRCGHESQQSFRIFRSS